MLVPVRWLKEYVDTALTPQEIAHALTMVGLEVEGVIRQDPGFSGVVTARVESVARHPNADKLSLCDVTDGKTRYSVVCGAPNVAPGITVAFARLGAVLPGDFKIKRSKIRGVESEGMICSERELAISEASEGIMHLPTDLRLDVPVEEALGLSDTVLEVNITPNRPDCLSIVGVARELAAATGAALRPPAIKIEKEHGDVRDGLTVSLEATAGCPRYSARRVSNVKIGPSPKWMQRRLEAAGIRPISNVVDVTNYVMLETGHPMHAFDARMIAKGKIVIRWAHDGEKLMTLEGVTHLLTKTDVLIADPSKAIALGGVMGGEFSGISDSTTDVVLEAAYFDPVVIRRTAKRLRMHTESSHRFERGCDPSATTPALDRACQLLEQVAGGAVAAGTIDSYPKPIEPRRITVRVPRVNRVLGTALERHRVEALLRRLDLSIEEHTEGNFIYDPEKLLVVAPTRRPDLIDEVDVIEEVARAHGYDQIAAVPPAGDSLPVAEDPVTDLVGRVRRILVGAGFLESVSIPFSDRAGEGSVRLSNPLKEEESWLRSALVQSAIDNLVRNASRQNDRVDLFELGRVFAVGSGKLPYHQEYRLSVLVAGDRMGHWRQPARTVDFYAIKGVVEVLMRELAVDWQVAPLGEPDGTDGAPLPPYDGSWFHPSRSSAIVASGKVVGAFGELHPSIRSERKLNLPVVVAEVALERLLSVRKRVVESRSLPAFPRADRDLAVVVAEATPWESVRSIVLEVGGKLLEDCRLFDVFRGGGVEPGKKSLAVALAFRHAERTLTDVEIDRAVGRIVERLKRDVSAQLREK